VIVVAPDFVTPTVQRIRNGLAAIAAEGDYERLMVQAICAGMEQVTQLDEAPNASEWRQFLTGSMQNFAEGVLLEFVAGTAAAKVDALLNAWDIAQVSPQLAVQYVRACFG
jgi:hypothetical protein